MKRILTLFAIVYGQISGFVLTLTAVLYFSKLPEGKSLCEGWGMSLGNCRAAVSLFLFVAFGLSGVLSLYRFRKEKGDDNGE